MRTANKTRIMVDTCPIISVITHETSVNGVDRYTETMRVLDAARNGQLEIIMPTMVITEFGSSEAVPPNTFTDALNDWVREPYIRVIDLTEEIALDAQRVVQGHGLKPGDAIILASALFSNVEVFYTYDESHLTPLSNQLTNRAGALLPIELPSTFPGDLFGR